MDMYLGALGFTLLYFSKFSGELLVRNTLGDQFLYFKDNGDYN